MAENRAWDALASGRSLAKLQAQLQPEEKLVIVGRQANPEHRTGIDQCRELIGLLNSIQDSVQNHAVLRSPDQRSGLSVVYPDTPTPAELQDFMSRNSRAVSGAFKDWSATGNVPYVTLSGNAPGKVELGMMDVNAASRTQAVADIG